MEKLPYLNLGCGATYHKAWTNIDFVSNSQYVQAHNLLKGVPCSSNSFKVVYHSHVLEHFPKAKAPDFIRECHRVLVPGGIIRIAIPDLEQIALNYIKYLDQSLQGLPGAEQKYDWTMLELFDQVVRSASGGEMIGYIRDVTKGNDEFLIERNGYEVKRIMDMFREGAGNNTPAPKPSYSFARKMRSLSQRIRNRFVRGILGENYAAYQSGVFRSQGEIHQWMYDRYSLKRLLEQQGFRNVRVVSAFESAVPGWNDFRLDGADGIVRKPDSLFVEAEK